jgi:hypothetical protein
MTTLARVHNTLAAAKLERLLGNLLVRRNQVAAAATAYAAAEAQLGRPANGDPPWWREWLEVKLNQATLHYWAGDSPALRAATDELRPRIDEHGTPRQRANFLGVQVMEALRLERYAPSDRTEALARSYCEAAAPAGDWDGHFQLAFVLLWRGKFAEAACHFRKGRVDARSAGDVLIEIRCLVYGTVAHRRLGDVDSARSLDAEIAGLDDSYGYDGLIAANRAWLAWRDGDSDATEKWGEAALAAWTEAAGTAPTTFQWSARFPLLAVAVERNRLACASEHARAMLDQGQQKLPLEVRQILKGATQAGSREAFLEAIDVASQLGYT